MCIKDVTMVITSCDRPNLLQRTMDSLADISLEKLFEIIIIEDSLNKVIPQIIPNDIQGVPIRFMQNEENIGLLPSIDRAYSKVKTPFILHAEDDWLFKDTLFVQESIQILTNYQNVSAVMMRDPQNYSFDKFSDPIRQINEEVKVRFWINPEKTKMPGGMSFNPGLRRLSDYQELGGGYAPNFFTEQQVSMYYRAINMRVAYLMKGNVRHIGAGNSAMRRRAKKNFALNRMKRMR